MNQTVTRNAPLEVPLEAPLEIPLEVPLEVNERKFETGSVQSNNVQAEAPFIRLETEEQNRLEAEAEVKVNANENAHLEAEGEEKENLETNTEQKAPTISEANKEIANTNQTTVAVADTTTSGLVGEDLGM
jgi:hypothetical protein